MTHKPRRTLSPPAAPLRIHPGIGISVVLGSILITVHLGGLF